MFTGGYTDHHTSFLFNEHIGTLIGTIHSTDHLLTVDHIIIYIPYHKAHYIIFSRISHITHCHITYITYDILYITYYVLLCNIVTYRYIYTFMLWARQCYFSATDSLGEWCVHHCWVRFAVGVRCLHASLGTIETQPFTASKSHNICI